MNTKRKGSSREHKTMQRLEGVGYSCTRAAASLGEWDVIAVGPCDVRLIQVKANEWPRSVEMEKLMAFRCPPFCSKEVWRWRDHARNPDIKHL